MLAGDPGIQRYDIFSRLIAKGCAEEACRRLEFSHSRASLKPGNVSLAEDANAKTGDFGLAVG